MLVDVPRLVTAYYTEVPDPSVPAQRVAFGTSGHRGSAFEDTFNEWHVLAISQAICDYRKRQGIDGPLFLGIDTHALSVPACASALEVLAANGVDVMLANARRIHAHSRDFSRDTHLQPRAATTGLADGIVITPSHNPPDDGGFKYNPPNGGPADNDVTGWIEARANAFLESGLEGVKRIPFEKALRAATTHRHDYLNAYVERSRQRARHGRDSRREHPHGRGSARRRRRSLLGSDRRALRLESHGRERGRRSDLPVHDGRLGRPDPHGSVLALRDAEPDRPQGSLRHRLRLRHRP